jgi:hypothetical protein
VTRSVFISYSHTDRNAVRRDAELLRASGVQIFIDVRDIAYGERWAEVLQQALLQCERVLVFWSRSALVSTWVEREWRFALSLGKKIVPTLLDTTPLPVELAEFQAVTRYRRRPRAVQPGQGPMQSAPAGIAAQPGSQPARATTAAPQAPRPGATEAARPPHAAPSAPVWTEHPVASAAGRPGIAIPPHFDRDRRGPTAGPFSRTTGWGAGATLAAGAGVGLWWLIEAPEEAPSVTVAAGPREPAAPAAAPPGALPVPSPAPDPVVAAAPVQGRPAVRPEGPVDAVRPTAPPPSAPTDRPSPAPSASAAPAPATPPSPTASAPPAELPSSRWLGPAALTLSLAGLLWVWRRRRTLQASEVGAAAGATAAPAAPTAASAAPSAGSAAVPSVAPSVAPSPASAASSGPAPDVGQSPSFQHTGAGLPFELDPSDPSTLSPPDEQEDDDFVRAVFSA